MKMRVLVIILFLTSSFLTVQAQRTTFLKSFGRNVYSEYYTAENTADGGYIVAGDTFILKLDAEGFTTWKSSFYPKVLFRKNHQAIQLNNGNYLWGYSNTDLNISLTFIDAAGDSINNLSLGTNGVDNTFLRITPTFDSKLLILQRENDTLYIAKIDLNGTQFWNKSLHQEDTYNLPLYYLIQLSDSSYIISAGTNFIKTNINGDTLRVEHRNFIASVAAFNNGYLLSERDSSLFRYDFNGNLIWENTELTNQSVSSTSDGNIIAYGNSKLTKLDSLGNIIWQKPILQQLQYNYPSRIKETTDNGFIMFTAGRKLLKTDKNGDYQILRTYLTTYPAYYNPNPYLIEAFNTTYLNWETYNLEGGTVDITYSTDIGNNWNNIVQYFPVDSGKYAWEVPEINSENTLIKITSSNNPDVYDKLEPSVTILVRQDYDTIAVNNVMMWFGNNGGGSNDPRTGNGGFYWPGGINARQSAVFADGLLFGGKLNGEIRVNGSVYRQGFSPGIILENGQPDDPNKSEYKIFKSKRNWQSLPPSVERNRLKYDYENWPADLGAPVIDVDNDGIYTPGVDDNILGDETFFFVNNGADSSLSVFTYGSLPLPLEFQTTIWGYNKEGLEDVVFKKYKIINKGDTPITDMYLSYWSDDDLGFAGDDCVGVDTAINMGYTYNGDEDDEGFYGTPPPAVGHMMVQGPKVVASINDSAWFDNSWHKGYKNKPLVSFIGIINSDPSFFYFDNAYAGKYEGTKQMYNYMQGYRLDGLPIIDPNTGDTTRFAVSGDPVTGTGWYDFYGWTNGPPSGQRSYIESTGPFNLAAGDTQEVAYAILIARGTDRLNSITKLRKQAAFIQNFYNGIIIKSVNSRGEINPTKFVLNQNYPNPFNPSTTIKYFVPLFNDGNIPIIKLIIYDILGRKIATLVNGKQTSGSHKVIFNADKLASGVYIYRLSAVGNGFNFMQAKKMVLLR